MALIVRLSVSKNIHFEMTMVTLLGGVKMKVYEVAFDEDVTGHYAILRVVARSKADALIWVVNTRCVRSINRIKRVKDD